MIRMAADRHYAVPGGGASHSLELAPSQVGRTLIGRTIASASRKHLVAFGIPDIVHTEWGRPRRLGGKDRLQ